MLPDEGYWVIVDALTGDQRAKSYTLKQSFILKWNPGTFLGFSETSFKTAAKNARDYVTAYNRARTLAAMERKSLSAA